MPWDQAAPPAIPPRDQGDGLQPFPGFEQVPNGPESSTAQPTSSELASGTTNADASVIGDFPQSGPPSNNPYAQPSPGAERAAQLAKKAADKAAADQHKEQIHTLEHAEIQAVHKANADERQRKNEMADLPYTDLKTALQALPDDKTRQLKLEAAEVAARGKPPTTAQAAANPFLQEQLDFAKQRAEDDKNENKDALNYTKKTAADMWKLDNKPDKEALHAVLRVKNEMGKAKTAPAAGNAGFDAAQTRTAAVNAGQNADDFVQPGDVRSDAEYAAVKAAKAPASNDVREKRIQRYVNEAKMNRQQAEQWVDQGH